MHNDVWIDESEYPDDKDVEEFGEDSPPDFDPLTIGYVEGLHQPFWTTRKIVFLVVGLLLISALLLPPLLSALA